MKILLDTNAFLRIVTGDKLPAKVARTLDRHGTELFMSIVSAWEIAMKPALKLTPGDVEAAVANMGITILPIRFQHLEQYRNLPFRPDHRDPFDRMLLAQARAEDLTVITSDRRFAEYPNIRVVWD